MKTVICLFLFFLPFAFKANSQLYYPNGDKISSNLRYKEYLDSIGVKETSVYIQTKDDLFIYFKRLTNIPVLVVSYQKDPKKIKPALSAHTVEYKKYLYTFSYFYDLTEMIKNRSLTRRYLLDIFKEPDVKNRENGAEYWIYKNYNAKITFRDTFANSADVVNYNAIENNGLSIPNFIVTGEDYSIGFDISLSNISKKTIKYSYITVTVTNPVDDKVATKTVTGVGPIKPGATGSYSFENIVFSNVAKYLTIDKIVLQYTDGTKKIISSKDEIHKIRHIDWEQLGQSSIDD